MTSSSAMVCMKCGTEQVSIRFPKMYISRGQHATLTRHPQPLHFFRVLVSESVSGTSNPTMDTYLAREPLIPLAQVSHQVGSSRNPRDVATTRGPGALALQHFYWEFFGS